VAKASSKKTGKSKKELLDEAIAEVVRGGKELHLESVDFSDPNRPKTCLEVDFPILPINHVAAIEGNAGKPIYQMSKWWARRRSSVFRSMLIAAATKAPEDPGEAAKLVWDSYYGNHQKNEAFKKLKVADIFMGGGTTIVEGARLGMQMFGNDLNPVAWLVVKNELAQVDPSEVQKLLNEIEAEVRPQTMPFYACDCPHGHRGKWTQKSTGKVMGETFDALCLKPDERVDYEYKGPEVIYTFWAKHGTCQATGCGHRTPIMSSPVIAVKSLTVKAWINRQCNKCSKTFDVEQHEARIAPNAMFVCAPDEEPHSVMDQEGHYLCPHCGEHYHDPKAKTDGVSGSLGKSKNKSIDLTVLVHPDWLKGSSGKSADGKSFGGSADDTPDSTANWLRERRQNLSLVEFRGNLPESFTCPPTNEVIRTDNKGGTVPRERYFKCMSGTCGKEQIVLEATVSTGKTRPEAPYAYQIHCPECDQSGYLNSGRYFVTDVPVSALESASHEYHRRKGDDLAEYLPTQEIPFGSRTHVKDPLPKHGYTHWRHMFNPRQLLSHALLLRAIIMAMRHNAVAATFILGAFQQFLRFNNSFSIWHKNRNCTSAFLSNSNYNPKTNTIETCLYATVGDGTWRAATSGLFDALKWKANPSALAVFCVASVNEEREGASRRSAH
jgi:putative DNA methylase